MTQKDKCNQGYQCGRACVSRRKKCRDPISRTVSNLIDGFSDLIRRLTGKKLPVDGSTEDNFKADGKTKPFGQTKEYKANRERRKARLIKAFGSEERFDNISTELRNMLKGVGEYEGSTRFSPVIYMNSKTVDLIANNSDPNERRLKNLHEVGTSEGLNDPFARRWVENHALGIAGETDLLDRRAKVDNVAPPEQRPVYAGFQHGESFKETFGQYGNLAFKFKNLDPKNVTITLGDSLDAAKGSDLMSSADADTASGSTLDDLDLTNVNGDIFEPWFIDEFVDMNKDATDRAIAAKILLNFANSDRNYIEAQIHTNIGLQDLELIDTRGGLAPAGLSRKAREILGIA